MNINLHGSAGDREPEISVKKIKARYMCLAPVLILLFLGATIACSSTRKTTLQGIEHFACSPEINFIDHNVVCQKEKRGNWVACQISGSIANTGTVRASSVVVKVEFGHELYSVRSSTFNFIGELDPGEKVDFKNDFFYYEPLTQYDIKVECDETISAQPSPVPTPRISFINLGLKDVIFTLAIDPTAPTTLYAGTETQGISKSMDGGLTWFSSNTGLVNVTISTLAIDPLQPTVLYAGTFGTNGENGAAYKSVDGGGTWTEISIGMGGAYVYSLAINPLSTSTIFAGTSDGIFRSTDDGEEWTRLDTGDSDPYIPQLILDPLTPTNIYAVSSGTVKGVLKSTNSGDDWFLIKPDFFYILNSLTIDPITPTILYAGTGMGVFKSPDAGETWSAIHTGLGDYANVTAIVIDPANPSTLYAAIQNDDVFKTTNGGESWSALDSNLGDIYITALELNPTNPTIIYAATENGVFVLGK